MANEVVTADLVSNGGLVSEILASLIHEQLYDPTDLRAVCRRVDWTAGGSTAMSITSVPGPGAFSSVAEGASSSNSTYTTDEATLTVARYARQYEITDLVPVAGSPVDLNLLVANLMGGVAVTITDLIAALFGSLSNSVGTSGVDMSVDDMYDAQFQLNSSLVSGRYTFVGHPVQLNDFRSSLRGETGAIQFTPATAEMLASKGSGYQGSWNGIDVWQSDSCASSGGNRQGAMFGENCFAYTEAPVALIQGHIPASDILVNAGEILVELVRDAAGGETAALAHYYPAVAELEDSRGVLVATDA
jgi:hypothetical protein